MDIGNYFKNLWIEGMKREDGTLPERMKDDRVEQDFWKDFIKNKNILKSEDEYIKPLRKELLNLLKKEDTILEIGPGWGNYTFGVSKKVKNVTCIDISKDILNFIKYRCKSEGIKNINTIHKKFEDFIPEEKYDVTFGVNCYYRMENMEDIIKKINNSSKRLCIMGLTTGPEKLHYIELNNKYGYNIKQNRRDYIHVYNILYSLGIYGHIKIVDLKKDYTYENFYKAFEDNTSKILSKFNNNIVEEVLKKYLKTKEGKLIYTHNFKGVLIYWIPQKNIS